MMKNAVRSVLSVLAAVVATAVFAEQQAVPKDRPLKVLMIGNSFSICALRETPNVAKSMGCALDLTSLYIGGCSLERHWNNFVASTNADFKPYGFERNVCGKTLFMDVPANLLTVLKSDRWDVITVQQASHFSWRGETYEPFLGDLIVGLRTLQPQAEIVFQETWSYTPWDKRLAKWGITPAEMFDGICAARQERVRARGLRVIPMGTAVDLYRKELPVVYTENSFGGDPCGGRWGGEFVKDATTGKWAPGKGLDVFHLGYDGEYLQALVWTAALFGADVRTCAYVPKYVKTPERAAKMKACAWEAVRRVCKAGADGLAVVGFDWRTRKAVITNMTSDCEVYRPVCSWRLTLDDDVWSEGSLDLYQLSPRASAEVRIPFRQFPPGFAPASYGRRRMTLSVSDGKRVLDRRTFDAPGKPQLFPATPARFRFDGDILTKPYLQNAGTTGFTVCLETRRELPELRLVWTADGRETKTPFVFTRADFSGTYLAKARVEGLKAGTKVAYEVGGEKGTFTTWKEGAQDFTCAIFGDFQSGLSNGPVWWDWEEDPFLCGERMFEDMVRRGCDFAVTTGDLADTADYRKELRPLLLERTCGVLGSKIPFYTAFGNHDSRHPASHFFLENPPNEQGLSSCAFFYGDCLFVCIDDAEIGNDKTPCKPELRVWFEKLLSSEAAQKARFRFVFQHVPFYVEAFGNCVRWLTDLSEKYGVDCVFSGDHHGYERIVRGKTRQVVNGCMGYFDHGSEDVSELVNWYGDETLAGGHRGLPEKRTWRFQAPGKPGVLGPETPVYEGLVPGYATLSVKGDTATWTLHGFNADGSPIGVIDSFTMKSGVRPDAPKGIALERYCYGQSPKGNWLLKYTLTGKGGRTFVKCEDDEWSKSTPILEKDVVGVRFVNAAGKVKTYRLLPDNTLRED